MPECKKSDVLFSYQDYDDSNDTLTLKIVPRIDIQRIIEKLKNPDDRKRKKNAKTCSKIFQCR